MLTMLMNVVPRFLAATTALSVLAAVSSCGGGQAAATTATAAGPGTNGGAGGPGSGQSLPVPSAPPVMPTPMPATSNITAPTNLAVHGYWQDAPGDVLTWSASPGAVTYAVYQYDVLIAEGITGTSYTVPTSVFHDGLTYTVTAADSMNMQSIPSNIVTAQGSASPSQKPGWTPDAPVIPTQVVATPEWNDGVPRVRVVWQGHMNDYTYNLYRDGKKVADGLWGLVYFDNAVRSGETHSYSVSGVNVSWMTAVETMASTPVTVSVLAAAPTVSATPIAIKDVKPNDDSALVSFEAVPGALDYRIYDITNPKSVKYTGGSLSVEMNGLDPVKGADLVLEAVDKMGPFQKMDGASGPGAMDMGGSISGSVNGQGDPSTVPNVIARSNVFHATCQPRFLVGSQTFFDHFRNESPLVEQPLPTQRAGTFYGNPMEYREYANDKWAIRNYGGDIVNSKVFFMGNHFMETLYDGGTPRGNDPLHNNNASLVMMPKATADISGDRVLHVTFEVDAHFSSRRWCDVFVAPAGDTLVEPGKFFENNVNPTLGGNLFRWEIRNNHHDGQIFLGKDSRGNLTSVPLFDHANGIGVDDFNASARVDWQGHALLNGTEQDLDKRHQFDLYISQKRFQIYEQGLLIKDEVFPNDTTLPFTNMQVYFVHQLYHTTNDRNELITYGHGDSPYAYNHRPWADERHWDNLGFEVLPAFPVVAKSMSAAVAVAPARRAATNSTASRQ